MRFSIYFAFSSHLEGGVDQCVVALDDQPLEESVKDGPGDYLVVKLDYSKSREPRNITQHAMSTCYLAMPPTAMVAWSHV